MMRMLLIIVFCMIAPFPAKAVDSPLQLDLASDRVDITTGFDGTRVVVFGTITTGENPAISVSLKGPERTMVVRRKTRALLGAWINRESLEFRNVPSYYDYATAGFAGAPGLEKLGANAIGTVNLDFYPEDGDEDVQKIGVYRDALIRTMQQKGFFPLSAGSIEFIGGTLFKAVFELPPGVPTGLYSVETILFDGDEISARETRSLQVGQVGFNARVWLFANQSAVFYGIFAVLLAASSGWAAFTFLRRD